MPLLLDKKKRKKNEMKEKRARLGSVKLKWNWKSFMSFSGASGVEQRAACGMWQAMKEKYYTAATDA